MPGQGPYQQKGRNVGVDGPQHGDQQRGADFSACHKLPDADGDCRGQQDERHAVQPDVSGRAVLQSALSLGCSLEGLQNKKMGQHNTCKAVFVVSKSLGSLMRCSHIFQAKLVCSLSFP